MFHFLALPLRQMPEGAECDQPKDQPQRAHARKREDGAIHDDILRAKKEQQIESRKGVQARAQPVGDEQSRTNDSSELHIPIMPQI